MKNILFIVLIFINILSCTDKNELILSVSADKVKSSNKINHYSFRIIRNNFNLTEDKEERIIQKVRDSK
jgi:hypothetical protein